MGNENSIPKCSPLGCVLRNWAVLTNKFMTKKKMISFCNTAWPQYSLDSGERWPKNGSLNYNAILQLDLFCKKEEKWLEIEYVQSFMLLYQRKDIQRKCNILAQEETPE
ncbi:Natural cytotoxicity triggering receptor 3 ligand 1 [Vulpes lagopus]